MKKPALKSIKNKTKFPDAVFLESQEIIGDADGKPIVLLGHQDSTNPMDDPLVALDRGEEEYSAISLNGLIAHFHAPVSVDAKKMKLLFQR